MTKLFTLYYANLISVSELNIHNDSCPICRSLLTEKCLECNDGNNDKCTSVLGVCNHGYHLHCIKTWLKNKTVCPLDNQKWEFKKFTKPSCCSNYDKYNKYKKTNSNIDV